MRRIARIVSVRGELWPEGQSTVFRLRAGRLGRGRVLYEHEGRGLGVDAAYDACVDAAVRLGYRVGIDAEHAGPPGTLPGFYEVVK